MMTTTELDELATRAANDVSLSSSGLNRLIVSVIQRTRWHWTAMSDQHLSPETAIGVGLGMPRSPATDRPCMKKTASATAT
jgi:hypothetical protein